MPLLRCKCVPKNFAGNKSWTQVYILTMVSTTLMFIGKQQNNLYIGHQKFLKGTNIIWY